MMVKRCSNCGAELSPWEGKRCVSHGLDRRDIGHLGNADAAVCVVEQQPTALSVYDVARILERDYGRKIHQPTLHVSLSTDWRFCWAGKGLYGLYRHRLFPGPRNLQGVGSLFVYALSGHKSLEAITFTMRWCGYRFNDFSLLSAIRRHGLVAAQLMSTDASDARAWSLTVTNDARMRRYLQMQRFVPKRQEIEPLIERCRVFFTEFQTERLRRLAGAAKLETSPLGVGSGADGNYALTGDLTRANYDATLAAARADGRPWLDGSSKPIVHILRRRGIRWTNIEERKVLVATARRTIFGKKMLSEGDDMDLGARKERGMEL